MINLKKPFPEREIIDEDGLVWWNNDEECARLLLRYPDLAGKDWSDADIEALAFSLIRINPELARELHARTCL